MSQRSPEAVPALLAGAGLGLHVASLLRIHALLAGAAPGPGLAVAGAVLAAWSWGSRKGPGSRGAAAAAALVVGAAGFLAPVPLGLVSGLPAVGVTALLAAVPSLLVGRALPGALRPALTAGAGLGLLLAGLLLLPQLGPTTTGLAAALLLAASAALLRAGAGERRSEVSGDGAAAEAEPSRSHADSGPPVEPLAAWVAACGVLFALAASLRPWPFALSASGFATLGVAAGAARRLDARIRLVLALGTAVLLVPWHAELLGLDAAALVASGSRPLVAPLWGGLALALAALGQGLGGGLLAGLVVPRPRAGGLGLAGLLLVVIGLGPSLLWSPGTLAALGFASLLAGCLTPPARRWLEARTTPVATAALLAAALAALLLSPMLLPGALGPWSRAGRHVALAFDFRTDPPRSAVRLDGHALVEVDAEHRPDEVLAGHLAGLIASERRRALVVGLRSGEALSALERQGFETIEVRETSPELAAAAEQLAGLEERPRVAAAPSAWPVAPGGWDAIVVQADDPSIPEFAPVFTPSAWRHAVALLAPGGVVVQRLRLARLGPEGLLSVVRLAQEALPETWLATADLARDGSLLLLAKAESAGGARLPWNELRLEAERNPRLDEAVARHLKSVLLFKSDDLLNCFAAGPRELDELEPAVTAFDPWRPGARALAFPAPEGAATQLGRAMLYARLRTVELQVSLRVGPGTPPWQDGWPFVGLESQLGEGWSVEGGALRYANRFRPFMGDFGLYRDLSRKIVFVREKGRIEVVEMERTVAGPDTVNASARSLLNEDVTRTIEARIHGHRALGVIREPGGREQHVLLTWHCPVQGRLYLADYGLEDARPGLYEEPLEFLGRTIRCSHAPAAVAP